MKEIQLLESLTNSKVILLESSNIHFFGPDNEIEKVAGNPFRISTSIFKNGEAFKRELLNYYITPEIKKALTDGKVIVRPGNPSRVQILTTATFDENNVRQVFEPLIEKMLKIRGLKLELSDFEEKSFVIKVGSPGLNLNEGESVAPMQLQAGDVISTQHGNLVVLERPKVGRTWYEIPVMDFNQIENYLSGSKPLKVQFLKAKMGSYTANKIGVISKDKVKKLFDIYTNRSAEIRKNNSDLEQKKYDENSPKINFDSKKMEYGVTMVDGNVAYAGDRVKVRFSNGIFTGIIKAVAGRGDGAVSIVFPGRTKGRPISPKIILSKV